MNNPGQVMFGEIMANLRQADRKMRHWMPSLDIGGQENAWPAQGEIMRVCGMA
jgi:hypothetical protein